MAEDLGNFLSKKTRMKLASMTLLVLVSGFSSNPKEGSTFWFELPTDQE